MNWEAVARYRGEMLTIFEADSRSQLIDFSRFLTFSTLTGATLITLFYLGYFKNRKNI